MIQIRYLYILTFENKVLGFLLLFCIVLILREK